MFILTWLNKNSKILYIFITCLTLVIFILTMLNLDYDDTGFQLATELNLFNNPILLGIDSISGLFILLTCIIIPLCILFNVKDCDYNVNEVTTLFTVFLLIELILILVFITLELVSFYILFEFVLIPFYYVIAINNTRQYHRNTNQINRKMHSFYLLFFFTISGSLIMLLGIIFTYVICETTTIPVIWCCKMDLFHECILFFTFFISFGIKIPIMPLHLWLPEAHVESPTEGSVILASILLKIGAYGIIRIVLPCFPAASTYLSVLIWIICISSSLYSSMSAAIQVDIKRIIAYSSIGHMNVCILGIFSLDAYSISGSVLLLIAHGFTSAGLFFCIGILYRRLHTKNIKHYSGLVQIMPVFCLFLFYFILSNASLPGTFNFIGELLILKHFFYKIIFFIQICLFLSIFLSSFYSILLYQKVAFSNLSSYDNKKVNDLNINEQLILTVLAFISLVFGLYSDLIYQSLTIVVPFSGRDI